MSVDPKVQLTRENLGALPPLCTDGAWGTELDKLGAATGQLHDLWNLDAPDKVFSVARAYVDAGAGIVLTNTFSSNRPTLARHKLEERGIELNQAGAAISKRAARDKAYVFGSIGPCGKIVMMNEISVEAVQASAAEQASALEAGGADAIVIETQSDLVEAQATLEGALCGCSLPVGISFTFDSGAGHDRTMMGVSVSEAYALAKGAGASFVGANCGAGIETILLLAEQFSTCGADLPIWVKGNAGQPGLDADGNAIYPASPKVYAEMVGPLLQAGAKFIGGCCGSTPEHIRAIAAALDTAVRA